MVELLYLRGLFQLSAGRRLLLWRDRHGCAETSHSSIYCLSFHVDYWNNLARAIRTVTPPSRTGNRDTRRVFKSGSGVYASQWSSTVAQNVSARTARTARKQIDTSLEAAGPEQR